MNTKKFFKRKVSGFSGITHVLISMFLLFLMLYLPIPFAVNYKSLLLKGWQYTVVFFFVVTGASLLPDLDSARSTARFQLGVFGGLIKTAMTASSFVVTSLTKTKNDWVPETQHRCLWHTPFISIVLGVCMWKFIPDNPISYFQLWQNGVESGTARYVIINYIPAHFCMFFALSSIYLGIGIITFRLFKAFPKTLKIILPKVMIVATFGLLFMFSLSELRYVGVSIALGYLFHLVGDVFSKGSIAVFWPIPIAIRKNGKFNWHWWWRPRGLIFGRIETGGTANTIINFVFLSLDIFLLYAIFIHGKIGG